MKLLFIIMFVFAITAQTVNCEKEISSNQEIILKHGQTIYIENEKLKIKFVSVLEDSRCPQGEQCIRAGTGKISLELTKDGEKPLSIKIDTTDNSEVYVFQNLEIKLVDLRPYPKSGMEVKPDKYAITLKLSRKSEGVSKSV